LSSIASSTPSQPETTQKNPAPSGRTKEELLAIRKAMMKPSGLSKKNTEQSIGDSSDTLSAQKNNMPPGLMDRLAKGGRAEISKKDMLKLTNKNYENLPEVK
jgi:hypothetical protein